MHSPFYDCLPYIMILIVKKNPLSLLRSPVILYDLDHQDRLIALSLIVCGTLWFWSLRRTCSPFYDLLLCLWLRYWSLRRTDIPSSDFLCVHGDCDSNRPDGLTVVSLILWTDVDDEMRFELSLNLRSLLIRRYAFRNHAICVSTIAFLVRLSPSLTV